MLEKNKFTLKYFLHALIVTSSCLICDWKLVILKCFSRKASRVIVRQTTKSILRKINTIICLATFCIRLKAALLWSGEPPSRELTFRTYFN